MLPKEILRQVSQKTDGDFSVILYDDAAQVILEKRATRLAKHTKGKRNNQYCYNIKTLFVYHKQPTVVNLGFTSRKRALAYAETSFVTRNKQTKGAQDNES